MHVWACSLLFLYGGHPKDGQKYKYTIPPAQEAGIKVAANPHRSADRKTACPHRPRLQCQSKVFAGSYRGSSIVLSTWTAKITSYCTLSCPSRKTRTQIAIVTLLLKPTDSRKGF